MSEAAVAAHQDQLLRSRGILDTQRRRFGLHLLHLQWLHGSHAEQHGRCDSR